MITNKLIPMSLLVVSMLMCEGAQAQSIRPESVNSAGASLIQSNGALSFALGELVVLTKADTQGYSLSGGFINGAVMSTAILNISEHSQESLDLKVYPNPITGLIYIDILSIKFAWVTVEIQDIQGRLIFEEKYLKISNHIVINTVSFKSGIYILSLKDNNGNLLGVLKILKS